jgi:hypothetical protein
VYEGEGIGEVELEDRKHWKRQKGGSRVGSWVLAAGATRDARRRAKATQAAYPAAALSRTRLVGEHDACGAGDVEQACRARELAFGRQDARATAAAPAGAAAECPVLRNGRLVGPSDMPLCQQTVLTQAGLLRATPAPRASSVRSAAAAAAAAARRPERARSVPAAARCPLTIHQRRQGRGDGHPGSASAAKKICRLPTLSSHACSPAAATRTAVPGRWEQLRRARRPRARRKGRCSPGAPGYRVTRRCEARAWREQLGDCCRG